MAFKSAFTGQKIDELLTLVNGWQQNPQTILNNVTEAQLLAKLTPQGVINKINAVSGNIVFTKFVDAQQNAGKTI